MPVHPPTDDGLPERPKEEPVPQETWERFLNDSEGAIRADAPKEPSARARVVSRRLREQDELAARRTARRRRHWRRLLTPWRRTAPAAPATAWRAAPSGPPVTGRRRLARVARVVVPPLVAVGVVLLVMNPSAFWHHGRTSAPEPSVTFDPSGPSGGPDTGGDTPSAARPFAGSPAAGWADGAAGIVMPRAAAAGSLTSAQVAAALAGTRRYLEDTELDPATLRGGWPAAAAALVAPDSGWARDLHAMLARPDAAHDPLSYLSRYRPSRLRLAGDRVKVRGRTTFAAGERGSVEIRTDYTFVYPFTETGGDGQVSRSIVRQTLVVRVYPASQTRDRAGLLWIEDASSFDFNSACAVHDGYLHPQFADASPAPGGDSRHRNDPYDLKVPLSSLPAGCGTVTRT